MTENKESTPSSQDTTRVWRERAPELSSVLSWTQARSSSIELSSPMETFTPGDITQKGYEKKRGKLLAPYVPLIRGVDPSLQIDSRVQVPAGQSCCLQAEQSPCCQLTG
ncbi:hypothetical protein SKAU_G00238560 [Synaphobranchus kaupii]|uniref:DMAP1-binding domain-containing protein n=1 Tax=Synaphobranchus kaupii TaxID=118154 RepID=A0A9Q1F7A4_SYNKA|nr:hypothetical protein SKAU_G00238560 [Synaphobranchus kaupii]